MSNSPAQSRRGLMLVVSSPSGAGKTSLSRRLMADHAELDLSISCTTRGPRPGEKDGRPVVGSCDGAAVGCRDGASEGHGVGGVLGRDVG